MAKTGVLLVNLGTPRSPNPADVFTFLNEFLTDARVMDLPWLKRQCLVRGLIVPARYRQSAAQYKQLWTKEGSPIIVHGRAVQKELQNLLGSDFCIELAMRYQNPSIAHTLDLLQSQHLTNLIILPLFPQYASATTGSVHQCVMQYLKNWAVLPRLVFINEYCTHDGFINAFVERGKSYVQDRYDHILFSFHGLPESHIEKADSSKNCLKEGCCQKRSVSNFLCYKAQCNATAQKIAEQLDLQASHYTICFQSRLGKKPWIRPYISEVLQQCAARGDKRILVFSPSFTCDCLETTCEIEIEYAHLFKEWGGKELKLVEGLNSHPSWIEALRCMILEQL